MYSTCVYIYIIHVHVRAHMSTIPMNVWTILVELSTADLMVRPKLWCRWDLS